MSDRIRLAVLGAGGRMGRAVIELALADSRFRVVSAQSRAGSESIGQDAGTLAGLSACGVIVSDNLAAVIDAVDVVVDFTRPEFTADVAQACAVSGAALVSGTTGMNAAQHRALETAARQVPVLWAPNMSVGVNLLLAALADIAVRLDEDYDAEIVEAHHRHKVDAPSGTAIALGEVLARARGKPLDDVAEYGRPGGRAGHAGPRTHGSIGFHSLRAGEIVGEHDVRLIAAGEEIRLGHSAFSRTAFASGALRAAAWLPAQAPGLHGMHDLLKLPTSRHSAKPGRMDTPGRVQ